MYIIMQIVMLSNTEKIKETQINTEQQGTALNNNSETSTVKGGDETEKRTSRYRSSKFKS